MQKQSKQTRQAMGCGYEVPARELAPQPWSPSSMSRTWRGDVTVCPGYSTSLPDVLEVCRARVHWEKNAAAFEAFCEGDPTEQMLAAVEILEGSVNEVTAWVSTPRSEGGGRD
jgi:hypothetical protein